MHENREISNAPSASCEGRSVKANSRTTDTYALEKSDCAVVPVNRPNKGGQLPAEAGEGRAQMKENIDQSHMLPTQIGNRMSQGLDGVRKAAKERKQERFTALLHHLNIDLLRDSFYGLKRQASPRIDGVTWQEYESGLEDRLADLHSRVHRGTYRTQPSRRVYIPKADGRQRPLGVAALLWPRSINGPVPTREGQGWRLSWLYLLFQSIAVGHRFEFHTNGVGHGN